MEVRRSPDLYLEDSNWIILLAGRYLKIQLVMIPGWLYKVSGEGGGESTDSWVQAWRLWSRFCRLMYHQVGKTLVTVGFFL